MVDEVLRVDPTDGFLRVTSRERRLPSGKGCFVAPKSANVAEAGSFGGGMSSYLGGLICAASTDVGVGGTLDEVLRHPRLSFLRKELPEDGGSGSSLDDMVLMDAESLIVDLEVVRDRGPIGLVDGGSASWFPRVYSSGNLGLKLN